MIRGTVTSGAVHAARASLAIVTAAAVAWLGGLIWFAEAIPRHNGNAIPQTTTDGVVVLTGGPLRLRAGLETLEAGRARKLFVSGVHPGVELAELLRAAGPPPLTVEPRTAECCIVLGHAADNTEGNAIETRAWMIREGYRSLRLVTASYHLRRSLLEFRTAMPGITIVPHPVFTESFMRESWWAWPGTLSLVATEYTKYLAALVRLGLAAAPAQS